MSIAIPPSQSMLTPNHVFLRRLRAAARGIQAGTPPDIPGLLEALDVWKSSLPVAGGPILASLHSAQTALKRHTPAAALSHLSAAIEIVERVQKEGARKEEIAKGQEPKSKAKPGSAP